MVRDVNAFTFKLLELNQLRLCFCLNDFKLENYQAVLVAARSIFKGVFLAIVFWIFDTFATNLENKKGFANFLKESFW